MHVTLFWRICFVSLFLFANAHAATMERCTTGTLPEGGPDTDLVIAHQSCTVDGSHLRYLYRDVNILDGGSLLFKDTTINFFAESIVVQNGGSLIAGDSSPIGTNPGAVLTIHLYGARDDAGVACRKIDDKGAVVPDSTCGVPTDIWNSNLMAEMSPKSCTKASQLGTLLPGNIDDCFYQYTRIDDGDSATAYFGHKVLAVSYGGTLHLSGAKGASPPSVDANPANSGTSWARLTQTLTASGDENSFTLDRSVDWKKGDTIVVTSTDYLPGHAEQLTLAEDSAPGSDSVKLTDVVRYPHWGQVYDISNVPAGIGPDSSLDDPPGKPRLVETRAAVGLLSRSIRIVSDGDHPEESFTETEGNYFGGHTIVRQGFLSYHIQGVEFYQLGQGGAKGHYPVHFHMDRRVPADTYVKDSSIHDSMTRWITLHATQGVTLQRNVGYLSIGHGFYLEDGTETDNKLYTNLGIFARAGVDNDQNKRKVPGILDRPGDVGAEVPPFHSDWDHPTVFWIMNGWNELQDNYAAGAGSCGVCYWLLPGAVSGPSQFEKWWGYASLLAEGRAGLSPLRNFSGNSCSSAMSAFINIGATTPCLGVEASNDSQQLQPIPNPNAPPAGDPRSATYYPLITGLRNPTSCGANATDKDCSLVPPCAGSGVNEGNCVVTTLDHFTTSFNWAQKNFAAVWLRPWWFLVTDSAITDTQQGGLTFVTGGGYTRADTAIGYWSVARKSVFIGNTQPIQQKTGVPQNPFASNAGPFNPGGLACDSQRGDYCLSHAEGVSFPFELFSVNQKMFSIYDGPAFQERNAYLDVHATKLGLLSDCKPGGVNNPGPCANSRWMYASELGVPQQQDNHESVCYLPNAAIAWKQSNGFYYPPAFHSSNLFFRDVDIRHFVIEPLFQPGTFKTDPTAASNRYCTWNDGLFANFTDIDRQTVLNDDDGSLTGLLAGTGADRETLSINEDSFFNAPKVVPECSSDRHPDSVPATDPPATAATSPYEYVTTATIADCAIGGSDCGGLWGSSCGTPDCYGVPLYRQYLTDAEWSADPRPHPSIRMLGQGTGQRSTLTVNHGRYYVDTQVTEAAQRTQGSTNLNVYQQGHTYYTYFIFAKPSTQLTFQLYVGKRLQANSILERVHPFRVQIETAKYQFIPAMGPDFLNTSYDSTSGLLTVAVDLAAYKSEFENDKEAFCQPRSYCLPQNSAGIVHCGCAPGTDCKDDAVCSWAVKDIDCPLLGCFGFGVTLPPGFVTGQAQPPAPARFTDDPLFDQHWAEPFYNVPASVSGEQCRYSAPPS